jgi:hypothetical protein
MPNDMTKRLSKLWIVDLGQRRSNSPAKQGKTPCRAERNFYFRPDRERAAKATRNAAPNGSQPCTKAGMNITAPGGRDAGCLKSDAGSAIAISLAYEYPGWRSRLRCTAKPRRLARVPPID